MLLTKRKGSVSLPSIGTARWCVLFAFFACTHGGPKSEEKESSPGTGQASGQGNEQEKKEPSGFLRLFGSSSVDYDRLREENDLKTARLWARVDQLAAEQARLKERLKVLEKGLTLGLIPEELKNDDSLGKKGAALVSQTMPKDKEESDSKTVPEVIEENPTKGGSTVKSEISPPAVEQSEQEYQAALALAHEQFRSGHYGRAIIEYDAIGKKFGDKFSSGSHRYWVAKSWIQMKEYATARQILADFLKTYPASTWAPRAKLELARVEWKLGLGETALSRLRDIIRDHPQEDAAEMAKMELSTLDKTL